MERLQTGSLSNDEACIGGVSEVLHSEIRQKDSARGSEY